MTNQDGIIKSLETLIKHEKTMQAQDSHIHDLQDILEKALHTITAHEHKLNMLCGMNITLANELQAIRNAKFAQGVN